MTWEIPTGALLALLLVLVLGLQVGRSVANLLSGGRWSFVDRADLFVTLPALVGGDAAAGLRGLSDPAGGHLLWWCMAATCVVLLVLAGWVTKVVFNRWGPGRLQGMATAGEAEAMLGRSRLRRHARVIRPDLYERAGVAAR